MYQTWPKCKMNVKPVFNTFRLRQHGRHFADDTFKRIFLKENVIISTKISLKFVPKGPINNIPALVQIMAWRWPGDKPLSEAMMVRLLTHICVTQPQWVNTHVCTEIDISADISLQSIYLATLLQGQFYQVFCKKTDFSSVTLQSLKLV